MIFGKYHFPLFNTPDGGGASAPAGVASPPADPPVNPSDSNPEALSEEDNWVLGAFEALQKDDEVEELTQEVPPSNPIPAQAGIPEGETPPSQQTVQAQVQPAAIATPAPVVPVPSAPAPAVGAVVPTVVSQAPTAPTSTPDPTQLMTQIAEGIQQQRVAFIEKLATEEYALSEKQIDDLGLTPEQAKLWALQQATVHVNTTSSLTQLLSQQLPILVNGISEARSQNQRREDEFFSQWPQLKTVDRNQLIQVFQAVNTLNPGLSAGAWSKKAGELACAQFSLPLTVQGNGVASNPQAVRTPGPIVRQTQGLPHMPAGPSTAPAPVGPQLSEWEQFARLLSQTDAGVFDQ